LDLIITGIKFELGDRLDKAVECFNEATIEFKNEKNFAMMYVTLGHLINIHRDDDDYVRKLSAIHQGVAENLDVSAEHLLEYLEKKLDLARDLLQTLSKECSPLSPTPSDHIFSKLAVKLSLSKTLNKLKSTRGSKDEHVMGVIESLEETRRELDGPDSDLVMRGVGNHSYVSTSVHRLKNAVLNIHMALLLAFYGKPFQMIKKTSESTRQSIQRNKFSFQPEIQPRQIESREAHSREHKTRYHTHPLTRRNLSQIQSNAHLLGRLTPRHFFGASSLLSRLSREIVKKGDTLSKYNYTSNGKLMKFTKIFGDKFLRWAKKESYLSNVKNCHSYLLSEIKGVLPGKITSTFRKSPNESLEPWLCMSIFLKNRPLDLYLSEDTVDFWYIGLSELVREKNPDAYCLTKGQYLWRKVKMIMFRAVVNKKIKEKLIRAKDRKKQKMTFCQTIIQFNDFYSVTPDAKTRYF
jgi:flagellar biosynthesis/type III secretory pathway chaperone